MSSSTKSDRELSTCDWNRPDLEPCDTSGDPLPKSFDPIYRTHRILGRGGMGVVLHVENLRDGQSYALKYCRPGDNLRRRFIREVRFLSGFHHPNIVPIVDAELGGDPPFFVMPLARGSLQDEVEILARELPNALQVFRELCKGVDAIHQTGVVHRDLKPSNVLRLVDGSIVVADLGAAKQDPRHSSALTDTCAIIGTLPYLAPEQLLPEGSRLADRRSDLFQLGKVLYQLATGQSPAVVDLSRLPIGLAHIVRRATAARPDDRYPDVGALLEALDAFESTLLPRTSHRGRLQGFLERLGRDRHTHAPNRTELDECVSLLRQFGSATESGHSWFDSLPKPLLRSLARHRSEDLAFVLDLHAKGLGTKNVSRSFSYADFVAGRMKAIFDSTRHVGLKTAALRITLLTAVALNRYSAMATFREMLLDIQTLSLAMPVAEMLREHLEEFRETTPGLDPDRLHPAIRAVFDDFTWIETVSF